jgi:DNA-binding NtrC family response regulator
MTDSVRLSISRDPLPRLLLVDDEERILKSLRSLFRREYEVWTTTDGYMAIEYLKQNTVDVMICDQRMPGMTGVQVLKQARVVAPDTVRILLTGYSDLAAIVGSINDGEVFRFINKPWDNAELARKVRDAVAISRALRAVAPARLSVVPESAPPPMEEAVLVVTPFRPLVDEVKGILGGHCDLRRATYLREVLHILSIVPVGVIVAESHPKHEDVTLFLKLLKQRYPEIVTVLVTPTTDAELAISLINQAQVFRLLSPPITTQAIRTAVIAAMNHYNAMKLAPVRRELHVVEQVPEPARRGIASWLIEGLKSLPARLGVGRGQSQA